MARGTASQRTLELLREWGWNYWSVERFIIFSGKRIDLFNIIDYIAITPFSTIGIQSCGTDFSGHIKKLTEDELASSLNWLEDPSRKIILIGWRKVLKKKGGKMRIYRPRIAWLYIEDDHLCIDEKSTDFYKS